MAEENEPRRTPPPASEPKPTPAPPPAGVLPVDYNVKSGDSGTVGPATDYASGSATRTPVTGSVSFVSDAANVEIGPAASGSRTDGSQKPSEARSEPPRPTSSELLALASERPVEALLSDPLGPVARKERRTLLGISTIALVVGWTGLVPTEITNLGLRFTEPKHAALLTVFVLVWLYYVVAFMVYAFSDFLMFLRAVDVAASELKRRKERTNEPRSMEPGKEGAEADETPWRFVKLVPATSRGRILVDFILPVLVAFAAIVLLVMAIFSSHRRYYGDDRGYSRGKQDLVATWGDAGVIRVCGALPLLTRSANVALTRRGK